MSTKCFVPRADGEGGIGTSAKHWGNVYTNTINGVPAEGITKGFRKASTAYNVGDIAYHPDLPTGYYLRCATAGTTGSSDLDLTGGGITLNSTVNDGTVVWTVELTASTKNLNGFVDDGITSRVDGIRRKVSTSYLEIVGGPSDSNSPYISLVGKDNPTIAAKGGIQLVANNGDDSSTLTLKPTGEIISSGMDLAGSAIVAKSINSLGYIKYASGLIIQWGQTSVTQAGIYTISFPISFSYNSSYRAVLSCKINGLTDTHRPYPVSFVNDKTESSMKIVVTDFGYSTEWIAIGS